ncbi:MAG: TMEM165/GDT1 family protein [Desulfohalobiaceae bacterium]
MDWKLLGLTFSTIFLAELGDKTQLACIMMAAQSCKPWQVFLGASLALVLVTLLGVLLAQLITQQISAYWIKKVSGLAFVCLGLLILLNKI